MSVKFASLLNREKSFTGLMLLFFVAVLVFHDRPEIAMWIGFILGGYSAISNDSIQTLGTFLASNRKVHWSILWVFLAAIMVATFVYGWTHYAGDISYGRLTKIPQPTEFKVIHLVAPIVLLILTRFKMPVSTTFLILSVFSSGEVISSMLNKTMIGYFVAFVSSLLIWGIIAKCKKYNIFFKPTYNKNAWRIFQWFTTAYLWSSWLQQDVANLAVFLPRSLSIAQLIMVSGFMICGLGLLTYLKGGRIQEIVTEKTDVMDVRSASIIDLVLGTLLIVFKEWNNLPMSTTWVFLGLLAGREISLSRLSGHEKPYVRTLGLVMKDIALASIGLVVSIVIALLGQDINLSEFFG